jgi:hypothetical protein
MRPIPPELGTGLTAPLAKRQRGTVFDVLGLGQDGFGNIRNFA